MLCVCVCGVLYGECAATVVSQVFCILCLSQHIHYTQKPHIIFHTHNNHKKINAQEVVPFQSICIVILINVMSRSNLGFENGVVALKINNELFGLSESIPETYSVDKSEPVLRSSPAGNRIYKRSIVFVLAAAIHHLNGGRLEVEETIGDSYIFSVAEMSANESNANIITKAMEHVIAASIAISKIKLSRTAAIDYFEQRGSTQSAQLIRQGSESSVTCNACNLSGALNPLYTLFTGPLVSNTSKVEAGHFRIAVYSTPYLHFRIFHAATNSVTNEFELTRPELVRHEPNFLKAYQDRKAWNKKLNFESVAKVNGAIIANQNKSVIQLSEALHDHQIVTIASNIAGKRLALIAGPSSSGKTTFAKRLCVALETLGLKPTVLSVDSYYKGWGSIDPRGKEYVDWEALDALNIDMLNDHLMDLLAGNEVLVPEYDMALSMPMSTDHWTPTRLAEGGLIIMEGIHCLNPELTSRIPPSDKYKIMISPLSAVIFDDLSLVSSSQVRMLRRMVRDYLYRGRSALSTLRQWPSVAAGERKNIYPHQMNADVVMNSGLVYEIHVLKVFAEPLLLSISPEYPEYAEAQRLVGLLSRIVSMPAHTVPPQSLLREFIGGSWFYDYSGQYKNA
jgi:uridine kinase